MRRLLSVITTAVLVKSNANGWSARMQSTGQWQCKWVVKSMQLRNKLASRNNMDD